MHSYAAEYHFSEKNDNNTKNIKTEEERLLLRSFLMRHSDKTNTQNDFLHPLD